MARVLKWLAWATGVACVLIGLTHFAGGIHTVPGEGSAGATVDSRERFYGAIFAGYGLAWLWAVRRPVLDLVAVRWLSAIFLAGGLGRLLSAALTGWPQWFQVVLTVIELVLPVGLLWLSRGAGRGDGHPASTGVDQL